MTALNTKNKPDRIKPRPIDRIDIRGADLRATLAPASWNVVRLHESPSDG
jgi:alpha-N-arabinofuranosidase